MMLSSSLIEIVRTISSNIYSTASLHPASKLCKRCSCEYVQQSDHHIILVRCVFKPGLVTSRCWDDTNAECLGLRKRHRLGHGKIGATGRIHAVIHLAALALEHYAVATTPQATLTTPSALVFVIAAATTAAAAAQQQCGENTAACLFELLDWEGSKRSATA